MIDSPYDAVVVGAGPNGLAAAITLAQAGLSVRLIEGSETIGGGTRSAALTLPGFTHDVCSAIHPLGVASPFFRSLPLEDFGLEWIFPEVPLVHPLDGGRAVSVHPSLRATGEGLESDADRYVRMYRAHLKDWDKLSVDLLSPLRIPRHPLPLARFGLPALFSAQGLARRFFKTSAARALFAGMAAHSMLDLRQPGSAAYGLVLSLSAHAVGWPVARSGSQAIAQALAAYFESLGGEITTGTMITDLDELPPARMKLFDITPRQLLKIAGDRLPQRYRRQLESYRYGPGVFKVDWALDGPIPWLAEDGQRTATLHLGGTLEEIVHAEKQVWQGEHPTKPFVILAQQSVIDPHRAPQGKHTAWAYCHVPHGSREDMRGRIETQVERFAPGFRERILDVHTRSAQGYERYNPNYVGGDINGGVQDLRQLFARPVLRWNPYSTPLEGVYLCSSATPPGGGVHGMCGHHAARSVLRRRG